MTGTREHRLQDSKHLAQALDRAVVVDEPFPHVVIEDALPAALCGALARDLPPVEAITRGAAPGSNQRFWLRSGEALAEPRVGEAWKAVVREGLSQTFVDRVLRLFAPQIRREHPDFEVRFGRIESLHAVPRQIQDRPPGAVGVDSQIVVNTPTLVAGTSVRGPHLDNLNKIYTGLLYIRAPGDASDGADLELFAPTVSRIAYGPHKAAPPGSIRLARTVPYRSNTLVLFPNSPRSLHGVSARGVAALPRYHFNFLAETAEPLFAITEAPTAGAAPLPASPAPSPPSSPSPRRGGLARLWNAFRRPGG